VYSGWAADGRELDVTERVEESASAVWRVKKSWLLIM
jgi:hypothetical protein